MNITTCAADAFQCPVCLTLPNAPLSDWLLFFPCTHGLCSECFPSAALSISYADFKALPSEAQIWKFRDGKALCPSCISPIWGIAKDVKTQDFFQCQDYPCPYGCNWHGSLHTFEDHKE